ncbi:MAG: hypothetical protein Q8P18_03685 [Pseudomonadota bacterium]|nr:hypothetical protein [Pseudomonadota bacterium]
MAGWTSATPASTRTATSLAQSGARVAIATTDLRGTKRGAMDVEDGVVLERGEGVIE